MIDILIAIAIAVGALVLLVLVLGGFLLVLVGLSLLREALEHRK